MGNQNAAGPHKTGDKIRVQEARTSGGKSHDVVVSQHLGGSKYRGVINSGPLAGFTVTGNKVSLS